MPETQLSGARVRLDAAALRFAMAVRGINQRELSALAGVSAVTISHAMNGRPVSPNTLNKLATALLRLPALAGAETLVERPVAP